MAATLFLDLPGDRLRALHVNNSVCSVINTVLRPDCIYRYLHVIFFARDSEDL